MKEAIILTPLTSPEVPAIIRDLCQPAHMNLTEGEIRKSIIEKRVYKATKGQIPFGVVTLTIKPLTEMAVWLSEKESRETWAEAIKKAILRAFSAPEVYRVKWSIPASCKNMLIVAEGCGFKNQGELLEEGPNRESLIVFGLSRNGNLPNDSLQSNFSIEKEKLIKDGLERKILSLETELSTAKQEIKNRENWLSEENTKRIQAENKLLLLEAILKEQQIIHAPGSVQETNKPETANLENVIATKLREKGIKRNENRRAQLVAVMNFIWQAREATVTASMLKNHFGCSSQSPINWVKDLESIGMVTIALEQINGKGAKRVIVRSAVPAPTTVDEKPEPKDEKVKIKPEEKPEIKQKVESAIETLLNPEISLTKGLSLKELGVGPEEAEKFVEAVQATNLCHIIGSPKDPEKCFIWLKKIDLAKNKGGGVDEKIELDPTATTETQTAIIPIEEFLEGEKERLKAYFFTLSKFTKAKKEISEVLKSGKPIGAEIFGSCYGIKKGEMPAVIALLCKEINADNKEKENKSLIKEVKINGAADYANTTVEIIAAPEISEQKIPDDKAKKPVIVKPEKVEEELTRKTQEKILAELSQTHREIFFALKKAGGSSTKTDIKNKVGIGREVCELCINTMAEKGLLTAESEKVSLSNIA